MKYLIIGVASLFLFILILRIFVALEIINLDVKPAIRTEVYKTSDLNKKDLDDDIVFTGKHTYEVFCSSCHGMDGTGNNDKAQNHTKRMAKKSIIDVINNGANNFKTAYPQGMPAGLVSKEEAIKIADYMVSKMKGEKPVSWKKCTACHGENGEGITFIAPNIKEYTDELVATVLSNGKKGVIGTMPNFGHKLTDMQMTALANYIRSIQK